jgi:type VI secretion system secreted protein Hcp
MPAFDAYLQIDGIPGECSEDKHKDWIELQSFSWGASQASSISHSTAGGSAAGKVEFTDLTFAHLVDKASAKLFENCVKGTHISTATLELCRAGGDKFKYLEIKLEKLMITNFTSGSTQDSAHPGTDTFPTETVTLNVGKIKYTYFKQNEKGGGAGQVGFGWDLTTSKST